MPFGHTGANVFQWRYSNFGNPSATPGVSVTPGASNAEGGWTSVATGANIAYDVYGMWIWVSVGSTTATAKMHLLDVGADSAGGTSYTALVQNLQCGQSHAYNAGGYFFYLPIYIKAGSQVAVRIQGLQATAGTVRVACTFYGWPKAPHLIRSGVYSETIGTVTGSSGTGFTPGNTGAEGTWQSLGTTTKDMWYWIPSVQINNGTITALSYYVDFAYGDATNKVMMFEPVLVLSSGTAEQITQIIPPAECYCDVPAGTTIYVRGSCSGTAVTGFTALITGIGG